MEKLKLDLSNSVNAEAGRNKTALVGMYIMNIVLCIAYVVEVLKGARTIGSYILVAMTSMIPCIVALLVYLKKKIPFPYVTFWQSALFCSMHT